MLKMSPFVYFINRRPRVVARVQAAGSKDSYILAWADLGLPRKCPFKSLSVPAEALSFEDKPPDGYKKEPGWESKHGRIESKQDIPVVDGRWNWISSVPSWVTNAPNPALPPLDRPTIESSIIIQLPQAIATDEEILSYLATPQEERIIPPSPASASSSSSASSGSAASDSGSGRFVVVV